MLCPECCRNAFEPEYREVLNPYLNDDPRTGSVRPRTRLELAHFRCSASGTIYYLQAHESAVQAYRRIIRDHAKD